MFITLEGIEGCGKSTLQQGLVNKLEQIGHAVYATREPGGSSLGQHLRSILLHAEQKICAEAELFLFLADRAQHVNAQIRPALAEGKIIVCDRYIDSTVAYQGYGRGLELASLEKLNATATKDLLPDLTILLDLEVEQGLLRAKNRQSLDNTAVTEGRFEQEELSFHQKVRGGFLNLARANKRFFVIDASKSPQTILDCAFAKIKSLL